MNRITLLLALLLIFVKIANAQVEDIVYLGIEDGLSNNSVNAVFKDRYGYMWFGTDDGLNRYDGYEFKVFRNNKNDAFSIAFNKVICIASADNGNLWIGTKNGISIYHNFSSTFNTPNFYDSKNQSNHKADMEVNTIIKDEEGGMWVATNKQGLLYKAPGKALTKIPLDLKNAQPAEYNVISMSIDGSEVWFVIEGMGLCVFNSQTHKLRLVTDQFSSSNCIYKDKNEALWIGSGQGVYKYNTLSNKVVAFKKLSSEKVIRATDIKKNKNGEIWVATDGGGVSVLDNTAKEIRKITSGQPRKNLNSNAVMSVLFDNEDRIWMGTLRGGINIIDKRKNKFNTLANDHNNPNSLINDFILSFCESRNGEVWIGTDGGGISVWNRDKNTFTNYTSNLNQANTLSNNNVTSIVEDHEGNIWIGTFGGGINKFDPQKKSFEHLRCIYPFGEDKNIWKLYCDSKNNIWVGTTFGGNYTYKLNRTENKFEIADKSLDHTTTIAEDNNHALWFGSESGKLTKIDPVQKKLISYQFKHPIRSIYSNKNGDFWIGIQYTGLIHLNTVNNTFKNFTETEGLCNNSVLNILADTEENLWISTFHGISKFNLKTKKFTNFYKADGLQSNQFNYNAALKLKNGTLLFGGIKGLNYFNATQIKNFEGFPKLLITGLDIMNKPVTGNEQITPDSGSLANLSNLTLPYEKASITIDFAVLEYSAPAKIKYAYYLEGWDKTWTYTSNRSAYYSRLTEGAYVLHIKSTNAEGEWNPKEKLININISPPWYRSIWAYTVYLLALSCAIFVYNRYRVIQAHLKYELKINKIKADKEAELNESKFAFFTNISHEFRTPLTLIINPVKELLQKENLNSANEDLQTIFKNSRRLLTLVDQLLLFRKADSDTYQLQISGFNFQIMCEDVFGCFKSEAQFHNIEFNLVGTIENEIYADKEKIEIILFNLLGNAIKYTPNGGKITLKLSETLSEISISVEDTGLGIPEQSKQKLFDKFYQIHSKPHKHPDGFGIGLYIVKRFVDLHKGQVSVLENKPQGSIFLVQLQKGKAHYDKDAFFSETEQYVSNEPLKDNFKPIIKTIAPFAIQPFVNDKKSILIVDDNEEMRNYIVGVFKEDFTIFQAQDGNYALQIIRKYHPDIIISDVMMENLDGIELCETIKNDSTISHIPIILLTASTSSETKLKGIKKGADDYMRKPFDVEILKARVESMLKNREELQQYFFNEIGNTELDINITEEQKDFLAACSKIIQDQIQNPDFNVEALADVMGMSHSNLYKKIRASSGQSANSFIRFIRLRKAAEILVYTDSLINEAAFASGINDIKYFRKHFTKLFGMQPSAFVKKYRPTFKKKFRLNRS